MEVWFNASANATVQKTSNNYTISVVSTTATAAEVTFVSAKTGDISYDSASGSPSGLVLTNSSGQTGYIEGGTVMLRDLASTEAGYGHFTVQVTATVTSGSSTLLAALTNLDGQGFSLYPKATGSAYVKAGFSVSGSPAAIYGQSVNTAYNGAAQDLVTNAVDTTSGNALTSASVSAKWTYTVYFAIAPIYDASKANGAAANTDGDAGATLYDTVPLHSSDAVTVDVDIKA